MEWYDHIPSITGEVSTLGDCKLHLGTGRGNNLRFDLLAPPEAS